MTYSVFLLEKDISVGSIFFLQNEKRLWILLCYFYFNDIKITSYSATVYK